MNEHDATPQAGSVRTETWSSESVTRVECARCGGPILAWPPSHRGVDQWYHPAPPSGPDRVVRWVWLAAILAGGSVLLLWLGQPHAGTERVLLGLSGGALWTYLIAEAWRAARRHAPDRLAMPRVAHARRRS